MPTPSTIFLTGASGFVGAWLLRHFADQGWTVTATGRGEAPPGLLARAHYLRADLRQPLPAVQAEIVIHAAALASDTASAAELQAANVDGTRRVFEATRDSRVFVYISSASVYDYRQPVHHEAEPVDLRQVSPYGCSKRQAEAWLLRQDWRERTLIILRPRAVYGLGDRVLLPRLLRLVRGHRMLIPGPLRIQCSLTQVGNLCAAVAGCLDFAGRQPGGVHCFNVADAEPYDLREVLGRLLPALTGRPLVFRELPLLPLSAMASLMEWLQLPTNFSRFGLAAVTKPCVLDLQKITVHTGYRPAENFWHTLPGLARWAAQVGLPDLRRGAADLPWRI